MKYLIASCAAAIVLSACSKSEDKSNSAAPAETPACTSAECKTDTTPTVTYYSQFEYKVEGDCSEPQKMRFLALGTAEQVKLGTVEGKDLVANITLSLFSDGTYFGTYGGSLVKKGESPEILFGKNLNGNWNVEENQITIDGLGVGNKLRTDNRDRVLFKVKVAQNDSRLVSPMIPLDLIKLPFGPKGETAEDYCARN